MLTVQMADCSDASLAALSPPRYQCFSSILVIWNHRSIRVTGACRRHSHVPHLRPASMRSVRFQLWCLVVFLFSLIAIVQLACRSWANSCRVSPSFFKKQLFYFCLISFRQHRRVSQQLGKFLKNFYKNKNGKRKNGAQLTRWRIAVAAGSPLLYARRPPLSDGGFGYPGTTLEF